MASPNIVIILCGNKKDLDADREVTFLEASRFAQENGSPVFLLFAASSCSSPKAAHTNVLSAAELMFLETSALTGENVEEGFLKCARIILNKIDSGERVIPA